MSELAERRPVVGYEGIYEVSRDGEVFRVAKCSNTWAGRKLKPKPDKDGYLQVVLSHNNVQKTYFVHRIVAEAFLANPDKLPQVNHLNGIKTDNRADNLEWCDNSCQQLHAIHVLGRVPGRKGKPKPEGSGRPKRPVRGTNIKTGEIVAMESISSAARFANGSNGDICNACQGKHKTAYGYRWEYA